MIFRLLSYCLLIIYACNLCSNAQSNQSKLLHLHKYTQSEGLPSYNIRTIIQDTKGFIWAGTQDGLSRFDGNRFLNYSKSSLLKNKICGVDVRAIIEDTAHQLLWVLPAEVGVNAININTSEVVLTAPIPNAGPEDWNISMIKHNDLLWIGTSTGVKIYNILTKSYESSLPLPARKVTPTGYETRSLFNDEFGNVWACYSGYGIVIYHGKLRTIISEIPLRDLNEHAGRNDMRFYSVTNPAPGQLIVGTDQGLRTINYDRSYHFAINNSPCKSFPAFNNESIEFVTHTASNEIYIAGFGKLGKFSLSLENPIFLEEPARTTETDWLKAVQYLFFDKEKNLWLGCQEGLGFISIRNNPFTPYSFDKHTNIQLEHVRSLFTSGNGIILAGLRNGLVEIDQSTNTFRKFDPGHLIHHIFQDHKGIIHISRPDGMFTYNNGSIASIVATYPEFAPYKSLSINSHLLISDSLVVLGTESSNGVLIWNPVKKSVKSIGNGESSSILSSGIVNNIYRDTKGNIWVLSDNLIQVLSPDFKKSLLIKPFEKETNQPYKLFFDMSEVDGQFWITSYGSGVVILDSAYKLYKTISSIDGLSNDGVYQIFNIGRNQVLVTSNNGLSLIESKKNKISRFFAKNGLHSNGFEEVAGLIKDGIIYAGGINGFTLIQPGLFTKNASQPQLYINQILIKTKGKIIDTTDFRISRIEIPNNSTEASINFSVINPIDPGNTSILYYIKERGKIWSTLNNNTLPLIGFEHGIYHLKVKAINEDGFESDTLEFTLIFLPKWYETWWFWTLIGLSVLAIIYALFRLRINQLKKEQRIRTKLASDLHDDLGSTMNSVKVYANLAIMEKQAGKYLPLIKQGAQEAITGIRDIIWVLDDSKDTMEHLFSRISTFASPLCEANQIRYQLQLTDNARSHKLKQEERRNLYMMLKEAVNNAIKYSGGQTIAIEATLQKGKPAIQIKDDGKGFATGTASEGNGLKNMQRRAKEIKYQFGIESSPGNGATIHLEKI